uniref:DNA polymerase II large subunit n=1 Tax=uncultured marine thaumarchaeote AD1000_02_C08 TaxID=1455880 RepID=A0A075FG38_9ARCH|nr:DNA polymerase II large subunit (DPB1) [uncultured marine thaumarchaeote AD1000_02_C08]
MEPEEGLKTAIRVGLAVVTEGVTVAPIQGLSDVQIRENKDGSKYACLFFAGPMRSAGGTESGFTVVLADHVRKTMNLSTYQPYSMGDDEPERILEELRMYERVKSFQFKVSDQSLLETVRRLPVEVNGEGTEAGKEVVTHRIRGEKGERITTNGLRGGALRVLNDGIIGRNKKLYKLIKELNISDWDWLENIQSDQDSSNKKPKESTFDDVISGRPVLSVPETPGGFRLRYGRSFNTGHATIGINPASSAILGYPIVVGTQVKINLPGKASTISFVDTIEGPRVVLKDGSLIQINSQREAEELKDEIKHIVYLGDILISYGDFLENNHPLLKSGYVEEIWIQELHRNWEEHKFKHPELKDKLPASYFTDIDFDTAIKISQNLDVPLHPKFLYYWDRINVNEAINLRTKLTINDEIIRTTNDQDTKKTLELAGIPHRIQEDTIIIIGDDCKAIAFTLNLTSTEKTDTETTNTCEFLSSLCKIEIKEKSAVSVGVRVGRPEKAMMRKQKPAVECIFPINKDGGLKSDILEATRSKPNTNVNQTHSGKMSFDKAHSGKISIDIANSYCNNCDIYDLKSKCDTCKEPTQYRKTCPRCKEHRDAWICPKCRIQTQTHSIHQFDLQSELNIAMEQVKYKPSAPFKGIEKLGSEMKFPEPLTKGLLRNKYKLSTYRDATIRYDVTNVTLTHASSRMINTKIDKLLDLGYTHDIHGKPLENEDQIFELFIQDIVIPQEAGEILIEISKFTDELLEHVYNLDKYYNFTENDNIQKTNTKPKTSSVNWLSALRRILPSV